jgi:predicted outer membrane repeat protein
VPLELTSLTLSHGRGRYGGCVMAYGDLTLADSVIEQCRAERGGAIQLGSVVMSLVDATLRDNHATGSGGAIALFGGTTIIADGARIEDNTAAGDGGAISGSGAFSYTPSAAAVWRNVGASSVFARNHADGNGGAVAMHGYFSFNLFVFPSDGPRIVFEDNTATGRGGAFDVDPAGNPVAWSRLTLEHALLTGNQALYGGGIASRGQILVNESEFADNIAQGTLQVPGRGGAIWTEHVSTSQIGDAEIRRSSFNSNGARGDGGAIASTCVPLRLTDVSLYDNHTYSGNGSAVASSGNTLLTHVTTYHHNTGTTVQSTLAKKHHTACGSQPFLLANSIVGGHDTCYGMSGAFSSSGGNQYGPQGGGCYVIAGKDQWNTDPEVFGLTLGTYGGLRNVLGWTGTPPQKNYGQAATCTTSDVRGTTSDVRGLPRNDGACDSGAFEQQP